MPLLPSFKNCCGCSACSDACPFHAITIQLNKNGFLCPTIDIEKCTQCKVCEKSCPSLSNTELPINDLTDAKPYATWSLNPKIRHNSASGGFFTQIATNFLQKEKSLVVGAALLPQNKVKHVVISSVNDLHLIQGSKYQQSETEGIYASTAKYLKEGYSILFSGTPCQIAGLYKYTHKKQYSGRLYTTEVICHGVPSAIISELSLKYNHAKEIKSYRNKEKGWKHGQRMTYINYQNQTISIPSILQDSFYKAFCSETVLRPSCYQCQYAHLPRIADCSMADYWGVTDWEDEHREGISLIIVNNSRGKELLENFTTDLFLQETDWEQCLPQNPNIYTNFSIYQKISISNHLHWIKRLPNYISKHILQATYSKKHLWIAPYSFISRQAIQKGETYKKQKLTSILELIKTHK